MKKTTQSVGIIRKQERLYVHFFMYTKTHFWLAHHWFPLPADFNVQRATKIFPKTRPTGDGYFSQDIYLHSLNPCDHKANANLNTVSLYFCESIAAF